MQTSGIAYWRVDYGVHGRDETWRRHLTELVRRTAPELTSEEAQVLNAATFADTYRTYDVDALLSIPQTLGRVSKALHLLTVLGRLVCDDMNWVPFRADPASGPIIVAEHSRNGSISGEKHSG